jgi:hypothetical protein
VYLKVQTNAMKRIRIKSAPIPAIILNSSLIINSFVLFIGSMKQIWLTIWLSTVWNKPLRPRIKIHYNNGCSTVPYLPRGSLNVIFSNAKCPLLYNTLIMFFENTLKLYSRPGVKPEIFTVVFVRLILLGVNFNLHAQPTSYFKDLGNPPCSLGGSQLRVIALRESLLSTLILRTFEGKPTKRRNVTVRFC